MPFRLDLTEPSCYGLNLTPEPIRRLYIYFCLKVICMLWKYFLTNINYLHSRFYFIPFLMLASGHWLCFLSLCFLVSIVYLLSTHDTNCLKIIQPKTEWLCKKAAQTSPNTWPVAGTCRLRARVLNSALRQGGVEFSLCIYACVCSMLVRTQCSHCISQIKGTPLFEIIWDELCTISGFGVTFNKWFKVRDNSRVCG